MFGVLPAYGFYIRHAHGVTLRNVGARLQGSDARSALVVDDVANLTIDGFAADAVPGPPVALRTIRGRRAVRASFTR